MRSIASNRYRLAPVNDNPALKRLLRIRSSETCWSSRKSTPLRPSSKDFAMLSTSSVVSPLIEIDDQDRDILIGQSAVLLQTFPRGSRHPLPPASPRSWICIGAAWRTGDDKLHLGSSRQRARAGYLAVICRPCRGI